MAADPGGVKGFLFADLRGYTDFVERSGNEQGARLLERYRNVVRARVAEFGGAEIRTEGDSFYVVFPSPSSAVRCALTILAAADDATVEDPALPIRVGIGVHAGETVATDEGYVGSAVNVAARLASQAPAGSVLVSGTVRGLLRAALPVTFAPLGRRRLKGIAEPLELYAVRGEATAAPVRRRDVPRAVLLGTGAAAIAALIVVAAVPWLLGRVSSSPTPDATTAASGEDGTPAASLLVVPSIPPDRPFEYSALAPGRYRLALFDPAIEFGVPDGWYATRDYPDGFELTQGTGEAFVGYVSGAKVQVVMTDGCLGGGTDTIEQTPKALMDWLRANPHLRVTDVTAVNIDRYSGLGARVAQAMPAEGCEGVEDNPAMADRVFIFLFGQDDFWVGRDEKIAIHIVDVEGTPVTLLSGTLDPSAFDGFLADAAPVIESIQFFPD